MDMTCAAVMRGPMFLLCLSRLLTEIYIHGYVRKQVPPLYTI